MSLWRHRIVIGERLLKGLILLINKFTEIFKLVINEEFMIVHTSFINLKVSGLDFVYAVVIHRFFCIMSRLRI